MQSLLISGINGNMGKQIYQKLLGSRYNVVCGVDKTLGGNFDCPIYKDFTQVKETVDYIVDFSSNTLLTAPFYLPLKTTARLYRAQLI